jgi:hypothetical protein
MEWKVELAESVRDKTFGHFHWLMNSHDNPGRVQNGEGDRHIDRVGPVNYKGLFTAWGEPTDAFYMFRSNYMAKEKEPMVYIVSHTWPNRWTAPGIKNGIVIYSNCDEVELFNDLGAQSLGRRKKGGVGTHFQWDSVMINNNILYAEGKVNGKTVARDTLMLHHLQPAPGLKAIARETTDLNRPMTGYNYIYRVNCGGPEHTDKHGSVWMADGESSQVTSWTSRSWASGNKGLPFAFGSQRRTFDPVNGTDDDVLFQTFRYGRHKLAYEFPVPDGEYQVELFFTEPWYGRGGNLACPGWRVFDVAINNSIVLNDFDIWKEAGFNRAMKKTVKATVKGGRLVISFPGVTAGQAVISAIAVSSIKTGIKPAVAPASIIQQLNTSDKSWSVQSWLDIGNRLYNGDAHTISKLPSHLFGDEWIRTSNRQAGTKDTAAARFIVSEEADVYVAMDSLILQKPSWLLGWTDTSLVFETDHDGRHRFRVFRKHFTAGSTVVLGKNGDGPAAGTDMYTVIVHQKSVLELPPPEPRPTTPYEAESATWKGPVLSTDLKGYSGKGYVHFSEPAGSVDWTISVGVGDLYALRFTYQNPTGKDIPMQISVTAADGRVLHSDTAYFEPTTKWDLHKTNTGTSINAGTYKVKLVGREAMGLSLDLLKVQ